MKTIFTSGDKVEIVSDWRHWKQGDKATVIKTESQYGEPGIFVMLKADQNTKAEKDCNLLYSYQVEIYNQDKNAQGF
jgi:hypothetical protein